MTTVTDIQENVRRHGMKPWQWPIFIGGLAVIIGTGTYTRSLFDLCVAGVICGGLWGFVKDL